MAHRNKNDGFGTVAVILVIAVVALLGLSSWYVYHRNHSNKGAATTASTTKKGAAGNEGQSSTPSTNTSYLVVNELGIRFKLTDPIKDAYYKVKPGVTKNGRPVIALYVHSWDSYPHCTPDQDADGAAEILTYTPGDSDPVNGDMATAYPDAPLINGLHYYIAPAQYDCTDGAANVSAVRDAFSAAYKTVESL